MMNEAEYLAYDRIHDGKYEYVNGEVVAMSGVSNAHDVSVAPAKERWDHGDPSRCRRRAAATARSSPVGGASTSTFVPAR